MMKQLSDSEGQQAIAASEGAMLFLRDHTANISIGMAATAMLMATMSRVLGISRTEAHTLLDHHMDNVELARAMAKKSASAHGYGRPD